MISIFWHYQVLLRLKKQLTSFELSSDWPEFMEKRIRIRAGSISYVFHMWKEKAVHILVQTICFPHMHTKHIWKTYCVN